MSESSTNTTSISLTSPSSDVSAGTPGETERTTAMFCHLAGLAGFIFPFLNIAGPFVVWKLKKHTGSFVDQQGKEALNFQITATIVLTALFILAVALSVFVIGLLLLPVILLLSLACLVLTIIGAIKARKGMNYRYPCCFRLIK